MSFMLVLFFDVQKMTVAECADRLALAFGVAPASIEIHTTPPIVPVPAPPMRHNFGVSSNQEVLNLFGRVFGPTYWEVVSRAGLARLADDRSATYLGPDIEALLVSDNEKAALIRAL